MLLLGLLFILAAKNSVGFNATENNLDNKGNPCTDKNNMVLAPGVFTAGGTNRACVSRFYTHGTARVQLALYADDRLYTTATRELPPGDGGCLDISVPQLPNIKADLFVSIVYTEVQCVWERRLPIRISSGRVLIVQTERARYRPGDTVRVRMIALKPDLSPSHGMIEEAWLEGPRGVWEGTRVSQWLNVRTRLGLAQIQYQLDALAPPGKWTIRAKLEDGSQGTALFWVGNYELPPFQLSVRHASRVLRSSDRLAWTVCVRYPWSEAVEGMLVIRLRGAGRGGTGVRTAVQLRAPKACHRHAVAAKRVGLQSPNPPDVLVADFSFQEEGTRIWQNTTVVTQVVDKAVTLEFLTKHRTVISPGLPYKLKVKATRWDDKPAPNMDVEVCRYPTKSPIDAAYLTTSEKMTCTHGHTDDVGVARLMFPPVRNEAPYYKFEAHLTNDSSTSASLQVRVRQGEVHAALGPLRADSRNSKTLVPLYISTYIVSPITVHFVVITRGGIIIRWGATTQSPTAITDEKPHHDHALHDDSKSCKNECKYYTYSRSPPEQEDLTSHEDIAIKKCLHRTKRDLNNTEMELSMILGDLIDAEGKDPDALLENPNIDPWDLILDNQKGENEPTPKTYLLPKTTNHNVNNDKSSEMFLDTLLKQESTPLFPKGSRKQSSTTKRNSINTSWDYTKPPSIRDTKTSQKESTLPLRRPTKLQLPRASSNMDTLEYSVKSGDEDVTTMKSDALLDRKLKVMLPIKVTHQMCPDSHLIAYFYYKGELVSASKHFEMDECFANKAEATWLTRQALPGSTVSLQVLTPGPALCALTVLDTAAKWDQPPPSTKELLITNLKRLIDSHRNLTEYDAAGECFLNVDTPDIPTSSIELTSMWLASAGVRVLGGAASREPNERCQSIPPASLTTEEPMPRSDFSEAWLWRLLPVDANGTGLVTARAPDSITRFEASAICLSKTGIAVSPPAVLQVFREFFIHADSPKSLRRGDTAIIRYRIFNYLYEPLSVQIVTDLQLDPPESRTVCVGARSAVARRAHVTSRGAGSMRLSLKARTFNDGSCPNVTSPITVSDEVIIQIAVEPEGVPVREQKSILLCGNDSEFSSSFVEWSWPVVRSVPGTETLTLWTVGDATGPLLADADSLVLIPRGCGEQNMAQLATNLLALKQLDSTSIAALTAREHVARGFTRQLQYIHPSGGFSAFGPTDAISSTWLTAFAVRHLRAAHQLLWPNVQVPFTLIRAERWLINQQMENGCFRNEGQVFHRELRGGLNEEGEIASVGLTAYVITSLIESTVPVPYRVLRNSFSCLRALPPLKSQAPTRVYAQALLAYAFMRIEKYEEDLRKTNKVNLLRHIGLEEDEGVRHVLELLKAARRSEGYVWWEASSLSTSIETTAYALLALRSSPAAVQSRGGSGDAAGALRWLASHRSTTGGFVSTQDTLVALEALSAWSSSSPLTQLMVTAQSDNFSQTTTLESGSKIPDVMKLIPGKRLKVSVEGTGCALVQATRSYNTLIPTLTHDKLLSVQVGVHTDGPFDCDANVTESCFCAAVIEVCVIWSNSFPEMALLEVSLPGGYGADAQLLYSQLNQHGSLLRRIELSPTNSRATLYLGSRGGAEGAGGAGHECYRVHVVGPRVRTRAAYVRLHDYYAPEHNDTQMFTIPEDCPPRIVHKTAEYRSSDNLFNKARSSSGEEIAITHEFSIEDIPDGIPLEDPLYDNLTKKGKIEEDRNVVETEKNIHNRKVDAEINIPDSNVILKKIYDIEKGIHSHNSKVNSGTNIKLNNENSKMEAEKSNKISLENTTSEPVLSNNTAYEEDKRAKSKTEQYVLRNPKVSTEPPLKYVQLEKRFESSKVNPEPSLEYVERQIENSDFDPEKYKIQSTDFETVLPDSNVYEEKTIQEIKSNTEKNILHTPKADTNPPISDVQTEKQIKNSDNYVEKYQDYESVLPNNHVYEEKYIENTKSITESYILQPPTVDTELPIINIEQEKHIQNSEIDKVKSPEDKAKTEKPIQSNQIDTRKHTIQMTEINTERSNMEIVKHIPNSVTDTKNNILLINTPVETETPNSDFEEEQIIDNTEEKPEKYYKNAKNSRFEKKGKNEFDVIDIIDSFDNNNNNKHYRSDINLDPFTLNNHQDSQYNNPNENNFKETTDFTSDTENSSPTKDLNINKKESIKLVDNDETATLSPGISEKKIYQQAPVSTYNTGIDNPKLADFHVIDTEVDLDVPTGVEGPIPTMVLPPPHYIPAPANDDRKLKAFYTSHGPYFYYKPKDFSDRTLFVPQQATSYILPAQVNYS